MKKIVIDRATWYRGLGGSGSCLVRFSDGKQCCLGFVGRACGVPAEQLVDQADPSEAEVSRALERRNEPDYGSDRFVELFEQGTRWPLALLLENFGDVVHGSDVNSKLCGKIIETNDNPLLDEAERERRLTELFAEAGLEPEFVGEDWRDEESLAYARDKFGPEYG